MRFGRVMVALVAGGWLVGCATTLDEGPQPETLRTEGTTLPTAMPASAEPATTTRTAADRTTPEQAMRALEEAIARGDVAAVEDAVRAPWDPDGTCRQVWAAEQVEYGRLVARVGRMFPAADARRVLQRRGLPPDGWLQACRKARWVVEGDVARNASEPATRWQQAGTRIVRGDDGAWRLEMPGVPGAQGRPDPDTLTALQERLARARRGAAGMDYGGASTGLLCVLEELTAKRPATTAAGQPAGLDAGDRELRDIGRSLEAMARAVLAGRAEEAARYVYADRDHGGAYAAARQKRAVATIRLLRALGKHVEPPRGLERELGLVDLADDVVGLAMVEWVVDGDLAIGARPAGVTIRQLWVPDLRKIGNVWKVDVTVETDENPAEAARRAEDETAKIMAVTGQITGEQVPALLTLEEVRQALRKAEVWGVGMAY